MAMGHETQDTLVGTCERCGCTEVTFRGVTIDTGTQAGRTWFRAEKHTAPCGRPCIRGGVQNPAESHGGYKDGRCKTCGELPVVNGPRFEGPT